MQRLLCGVGRSLLVVGGLPYPRLIMGVHASTGTGACSAAGDALTIASGQSVACPPHW